MTKNDATVALALAARIVATRHDGVPKPDIAELLRGVPIYRIPVGYWFRCNGKLWHITRRAPDGTTWCRVDGAMQLTPFVHGMTAQ